MIEMKYIIYYQDSGNTTKSTFFASSEEEAKTALKKDIPNASIIKILESEGHNGETVFPEQLNLKNYKVVYHFGGRTDSTIVSANDPEEAEEIILQRNSFRTITETSETDEPVYGYNSDKLNDPVPPSTLVQAQPVPPSTLVQTQPVTQPAVVNLSDSTIEKLAEAIASKHSAKNRHKPKQRISIDEIDITIGDWFGVILKASVAAIPVYLILVLITGVLFTGVFMN
jgi:hypothetical protein